MQLTGYSLRVYGITVKHVLQVITMSYRNRALEPQEDVCHRLRGFGLVKGRKERSAEYVEYVRETGVNALRSTEGNQGVLVLKRDGKEFFDIGVVFFLEIAARRGNGSPGTTSTRRFITRKTPSSCRAWNRNCCTMKSP